MVKTLCKLCNKEYKRIDVHNKHNHSEPTREEIKEEQIKPTLTGVGEEEIKEDEQETGRSDIKNSLMVLASLAILSFLILQSLRKNPNKKLQKVMQEIGQSQSPNPGRFRT